MTETASTYVYCGHPPPPDTVPDLLRDIERLAGSMRGMTDEANVLRELARRIPQWQSRAERLGTVGAS